MDNKKAIEMLEYIRHTGNGESEYKNNAQGIAIDMAIEALKYDVDKVIAELEYESWGYFKIEEMYKKGAVDLRDAVKIIRRGGKE